MESSNNDEDDENIVKKNGEKRQQREKEVRRLPVNGYDVYMIKIDTGVGI